MRQTKKNAHKRGRREIPKFVRHLGLVIPFKRLKYIKGNIKTV
jgi:hypothetical protein